MNQDTYVIRYARWVMEHPWAVILISILCVAAAMSGFRFLHFTTNYRVFFSEHNPQLIAFESLERMYTKNDNVVFIVSPRDGNVFTPSTLKTLQDLTQQAWKIPYSIRVDSITNFQHTEAEGDELIVQDLVPQNTPLDSEALQRIRSIALAEPLLANRLISKSGDVTGVNITVQLPEKHPTSEVPEVVNYVRMLADKIMADNPNVEVRLSGMVMLNNAFSESSQTDMQFLVPLSFGLMLATLAVLLRGITVTVGTFLVIVFSIITALGVGGYIGFPITPPSASTPQIVLTVAIANSVHILITFLHSMRLGMDKKAAMVESLRINMQPVFLASFTTTLGFLTMNFADVPPFMHLGNMVAIGVLASFLFSIFFLPAFIALLPVHVSAAAQTNDYTLVNRVGEFVVKRRTSLIWGMSALVLLLIAFIPRNELNDIFVHYFDHSVKFRQDADYLTDHLSGLYIVDYSLDSGEPDSINNPAFLQDVEKLANWYRAQPETVHVNTFTDIMKRLNKNMHADNNDFYIQPNERNLAAQYLLLYEMSLPLGLDINNQINVDKSATRFSVTLKTISTSELIALENRADDWIRNNAPTIKRAEPSGPSAMFSHISKKNVKSMLLGTTIALVLISFILIVALRSVKIGLISMIPNLIPAAMGFGLWGLIVGEVGLALSVVTGMTLGIVVDDTVHFLSKYLRARKEKNLNSTEAVRYAFNTVGMAMVTTSVVLVVGFSVLAFSSFELNSGMGLLTAIVIAFALIADFFLLPSLLMNLEEKTNEETDSDTPVADAASA